MRLSHNGALSNKTYQVFQLELPVDDTDVDSRARNHAALEIGSDLVADYNSLNGYQRAKWNAAYHQALKTEALRIAFKSPEVIWLVKQDAEFDVHPLSWTPFVDNPALSISVSDKKLAMLFKLTFGGR
ncbi:hypothetical protein [Sphingomonas sp. M1A8_2b]